VTPAEVLPRQHRPAATGEKSYIAAFARPSFLRGDAPDILLVIARDRRTYERVILVAIALAAAGAARTSQTRSATQ
jgi:hypothetical protein